jgi:hypothetical protein
MSRLDLVFVFDRDISVNFTYYLFGSVVVVLEIDGVVAVLGNKRDQSLERSVTVVVDKFSGASTLEFQGRETRDLKRSAGGQVVLGSVHFSAAVGEQ